MREELERQITGYGCKSRFIPAARLEELRAEIDCFAQESDLNGFQQFILQKLYRFDTDAAGFPVRSVLLVAAPAPAYAHVRFTWQGRVLHTQSLVRAMTGGELAMDALPRILCELLSPYGYHVAPAPAVPLKRLAARSGLARYGRNNVTYVEGMGSFLNFFAYFTDVPGDSGEWAELRLADRCASCRACQANCPTGAIRADRFLIDNERCLSYFNESPGEFPAWLPLSAHHCVYDCLKCQAICPMNREYMGNTFGPVEFDETETGLLLSGADPDKCSPDLQKKLQLLGMDPWLPAIPRNLRVLFEQSPVKTE